MKGLHALIVLLPTLLPASPAALAEAYPMPAPTTLAEQPHLMGEVIDRLRYEFAYFTPYGLGPVRGRELTTGSVGATVVRSRVDGSLDFHFHLTHDASSLGVVYAVDLTNGFYRDDFTYVAHQLNDGPVPADRFQEVAHLDRQGSAVDWTTGKEYCLLPPCKIRLDFYSKTDVYYLEPGNEAYFVIDTNARHYSRTGAMQVWDFHTDPEYSSGALPMFAPAIPEPGSVALLAAGLGTLVGWARRDRARSGAGLKSPPGTAAAGSRRSA
jgi:hypothetical protein